MSEVNSLEQAEAMISVLSDCDTPDAAREAVSSLGWFFHQVGELNSQYKRALLEWVDAHDDLTVGHTRYYVGESSKYEESDRSETIQELLDAAGGDLDRFGEVISKNGIKHDAANTLMGLAAFERCFRKVTQIDLKTGKPIKVIKEDRRD